MLGSAVLVCLSGLMFSSSRFTGPEAGYYAAEYNGLVSGRSVGGHSDHLSRPLLFLQAYVVILLVSFTLIYYFSCFICDVLLMFK